MGNEESTAHEAEDPLMTSAKHESLVKGKIFTNTQNECLTQVLEQELGMSAGPVIDSAKMYCPRVWDSLGCWPPTLPNTTAWISCPDYLYNLRHNIGANASRFCTEDGTWWKTAKNETLGWSDYSPCNYTSAGLPAIQPEINLFPLQNISDRDRQMMAALPYLKALTVTGYSISLISLLAAITILLAFKRLYCPRNTLHINLFVSFIFRALVAIISRSDFIESDSHASLQEALLKQNGVGCRIMNMIFHYVIMANYFWIFIEGCYLNSIMSFSVFTDHSKIWPHIVGGWVPPMVFVGIWATLRAILANKDCWGTHKDEPNIFWMIRGPITATIVMNCIFFLNISRIIFIQFKNHTNLREQQSSKLKYRKLGKATLVLLAVFGIHYALLIIVAQYSTDSINPNLEITWLVIDLTFVSFQGLLASSLLCFANGEVRNEVGRLMFRHRGVLDSLRRSSSHISTSRIRQNSEHTLDRVESLRIQPPRASTYSPMAKKQVSLKPPPTICNPASCESLYIANTAENTAHNTAHNSDEEEVEDQMGGPPIYMRQPSQTITLIGSRSSNGSVHYKNSDK